MAYGANRDRKEGFVDRRGFLREFFGGSSLWRRLLDDGWGNYASCSMRLSGNGSGGSSFRRRRRTSCLVSCLLLAKGVGRGNGDFWTGRGS